MAETILVLEDDATIRKMIIRVLERAGYVARGASSPTEAIELAGDRTVPLRLLITDFSFHAVTGRQVAERLQREYPDLRVLYISGHPEFHLFPEGGPGPVAGFLQKPFSVETLLEQVRGLLH
jgi:DNA-binding NtrC family response regulator